MQWWQGLHAPAFVGKLKVPSFLITVGGDNEDRFIILASGLERKKEKLGFMLMLMHLQTDT